MARRSSRGGRLALALRAAARESKPTTVQPKPKAGGARTTFTVHYDSLGQEGFGGDQLYVRGPQGNALRRRDRPRRRRARGRDPDDRDGAALDERSDIPRYEFAPRDPDTRRRLGSWCRGEYRGWVQGEEDSGPPEKHTRFRFRVR